jgi:hypothetical protein
MIIKISDLIQVSLDTLFKIKLSPGNDRKEGARVDIVPESKIDIIERKPDMLLSISSAGS